MSKTRTPGRWMAASLVATVLAACGGTSTTTDDGTGPVDPGRDLADTADVPVVLDPGRDDAPPGADLPPEGTDEGGADDPGGADTAGECGSAPYPAGCPCTEAKDCLSNACGLLFGEKVCYSTCVTDCPEGFSCELVQVSGQDPLYLCVPASPGLCLPCTNSAGCGSALERCVAYASGGSFCANPCETNTECPEGYACADSTSTEGGVGRRCVRSDGECPCSAYAVDQGLSTPCERANEYGFCSGRRACTADGLTACDAREPRPEVCFNDVDEDCDGVSDDADVCTGCVCGNGLCQSDQCGEGWNAVTRTCARDCTVCGDGACAPGEGPIACPGDCCRCGDGTCQADTCGESAGSCPADCAAATCGDGTCQAGEDAADCPRDCPRGTCGNRTCDPDETALACPSDCAPGCGDCMCSPPESYSTCPVDCGYCGDGWCVARCDRLYAPETLDSCFGDCCVPACADRACGSDGCGGTCGTCPDQNVCTDAGACVCVPACTNRLCGGDGCGGKCGDCGEGTLCADGQCRSGCVTSATCGAGDECRDGACVPDIPDDAVLRAPLAVESVPNAATPTLRAAVTEAGVTDVAGAGAGVTAQVGYGPAGTSPSADAAVWTWAPAAYDGDDGAADVYRATLTAITAGQRAWTFRFSLDGLHWVIADATGLVDGFDAGALGAWTVPAAPTITRVQPAFGTVLGGETIAIQGTGFRTGATMTVDGAAVTPSQVTATLIVIPSPAHAPGPVTIRVANPDAQAATGDFLYVRRFTPTLDGNLSEWPALLQAGRNTATSDWDPALNRLDTLYVAFDAEYLYVAVAGKCESKNTILGYVDTTFGTAGGVNQMKVLHDNAGNGDLDDAICNLLDVTAAGFGAEYAFGTRGMASYRPGDPLANLGQAGWRALDPPWDLPWIVGTVVTGNGAVEAGIPLATLYPGGVPAAGSRGAVFAKLVDRFGDAGGISNQALPQSASPTPIEQVDTVASFDIRK